MFDIIEIISNSKSLEEYLYVLNLYVKKNISVSDLIKYAGSICIGLPKFSEVESLFRSNKDKGGFGKIIEYALFGQAPNNNSTSDLSKLGYDIKTCAFKRLKNLSKNAKERQTLTNCGNTNDYASFSNICESKNFSECVYYEKIKKFILFVRNDDKILYKSFEQILSQSIAVIVCFNIESLSKEMIEIIDADYSKIRDCVLEKRVSQKGQMYLHIHPHGAGHGSGNRALGFTSKFITMVVALQLAKIHEKSVEDIIIKTARGVSIKKDYL